MVGADRGRFLDPSVFNFPVGYVPAKKLFMTVGAIFSNSYGLVFQDGGSRLF